MPERAIFNDGNHVLHFLFVRLTSAGRDENFFVRLGHCVLIDENFKRMLQFEQPRESKVMSCPPCEDSTDHRTRMLAALSLDFSHLRKNICFASKPGYKITG